MFVKSRVTSMMLNLLFPAVLTGSSLGHADRGTCITSQCFFVTMENIAGLVFLFIRDAGHFLCLLQLTTLSHQLNLFFGVFLMVPVWSQCYLLYTFFTTQANCTKNQVSDMHFFFFSILIKWFIFATKSSAFDQDHQWSNGLILHQSLPTLVDG